ncbi:hypothetical protein Lser_V15G28925 [Lactuca serriola]
METDVTHTPLVIVYPANNQGIELKSSFIHQLTKFHGLDREYPQKHLKSFHMICVSMLHEHVTLDDFKLTAFPLTLEDKAREWLFNLPLGSIRTWEELLKAINSNCPQHNIPEQLLLQQLYEGMNERDRRMIDASSGGDIFNKTPHEIRSLFGTISQSQRNFGARNEMKRNSPQMVGEVSNTQHLESKLLDLTNVLSQMVVGSGQQLMVCGICAMTGHYTDKCPSLGQSSGNHQMSLQELVTSLAQSQIQFQQETKNTFSNIQAQTGDLATALNKMEQRRKLPSQTEKNPNVSAITLRSGKTLGESNPKRVSREEEDEVIIVEPSKVVAPSKEPVLPNVDQPDSSNKPIKPLVIPPPFPSQLASSKKQEEEKEILETFRKVQINISLLDAIKQIPRYAKFLKDLCTNKRKFKANEKIQVNANVSAVIQKKLPPKCKDPGMFAIPCTIGDLHNESVMLDLGASINVMPYSVFQSLNVGPLEETGVIIQLADKSSVFPRGVLEDILVQVNQLVFPADFYVIDLEEKTSSKSSMILLGRRFMNTAHTIIYVHNGKTTMEFDGETIHFNIFEAMRYPSNISPLYRVDVIEPITQELFELSHGDILEMVLNLSLDCESLKKTLDMYILDSEVEEIMKTLEVKNSTKKDVSQVSLSHSPNKMPPSIIQPPTLELKVLPSHLKYVYLVQDETLPVIISSQLKDFEEDQLVEVLKEHKEAMGWTIADIKGISPNVCTHKILMEDDCKPRREDQRRLNPPMMEVVKKEIIKLLDGDMIYPISESKWVSPVQVVPKKTGITVVENNKGVMVPT